MTTAVDPFWEGSVQDLLFVPAAALAIYAMVILLTRLNGLRSFSEMSAFDFAMNIAIGSVVATTILSPEATLVEGVVAVAMLFLLQRIIALMRQWGPLERLLDNEPRFLVRDGEVNEANLRRCHLTHEDLRSKIRGAGILRMQDVAAVVMETSGHVTVLRRDGRDDGEMLQGVQG